MPQVFVWIIKPTSYSNHDHPIDYSADWSKQDGVAPEAKVTARGMVSRRNTAFHDGGKPRLE